MKTAYSYVRFSHEGQRLGHSEQRQIERAKAYAAKLGLPLDTSLRDLAISAFRGKHRKKGSLAGFLARIKSGDVAPGSVLIIEAFDRLSRENVEEATGLLLDITRACIDVHFVGERDRAIFIHGQIDTVQLVMAVIKFGGTSAESEAKSARLTIDAVRRRELARNGTCFSARVPGWLIGTKNRKIEPHPEHAKTVKRIFQLASEGIGCSRIVDILNKERIPAFNRTKRWYDMYVSGILRSKAVLGEYQPGTFPRGGTWAPAGDPIKDYYPRIVTDDLWQRVQDIRAGNWARGKVKVGKYHGSGRASWRNLFTGLTVDEDGDSMIYKRVADRQYLISSDRRKFKTHQLRYEKFEAAMLRLLDRDIDWKSLAKQSTPIEQELKLQLQGLTEAIIHKERLRTRYLRVIEGEAEPDQEIVTKFRETGLELRKLKDKKESIERSLNNAAAPRLTKIPVFEYETAEQSNLRLKDEIRKRVARIQLAFNAEIILAKPKSLKQDFPAGLRSGKGQIVGTITFTNGAVSWVVFDGNRATLLFGRDR
jgi:Recombinase/Resolvase, N terminal domain